MEQSAEVRCAQCNTRLSEGDDREVTDDGTFCRHCFDSLTAQLHQAIGEQGQGINYPMATVGGLLGGVLGALVWWGFTAVTGIAFGLVAIVIGFAVGKGTVMLAGDKRHLNLQILSVGIALASFAYSTYLVNRTFIHKAWAADPEPYTELPLLPSVELFSQVATAGASIMDLVFLAIVVWEAWKIPAPIKLGDG